MSRLIGRTARRTATALGVATAIGLCVALTSGGAVTVRADENEQETEQDVEQGAQVAVRIIDFGFMPASVTVPVGGRVTWTNTGNAPHTSTSQAGGWDSGRLTNGQTFSFTFPRAGSFAYMCTIHPQMMGTVVVQAAGAAPAAAAPAVQPPRPVASPPAQRPAAAPAAARPAAAPAAQRPAAAPVVRAAAPPAAAARAMPRTGAGVAADNNVTLPALALSSVLVFAGVGWMLRRRKA